MKIMVGNTPLKSAKIHCYDTSDATMIASDLQAGVTGWAKGKKITGTGKSFEFACYGMLRTNTAQYIPTDINVIEIACTTNPVQLNIALSDMKNTDFTVSRNVGSITIDGVAYPLTAQAANNVLTVSCDQDTYLEVFYGKDNYI